MIEFHSHISKLFITSLSHSHSRDLSNQKINPHALTSNAIGITPHQL
jgi:hypothetical protein